MTTPTAAPVPSTNPQDLLFNAETLDKVINGSGPSFVDRLGVQRRTVAGAMATLEVGVSVVQARVPVVIATMDEAEQAVQIARQTTLAAFVAKLLNLTQPELDMLSGADGASMIGSGIRSVANRLADFVSVRDEGAVLDGVTDDSDALFKANAKAAGRPILIDGVMRVVSSVTITSPLVDVTRQIFTMGSNVTIANGLAVRPEWFGSGFGTVYKAIVVLPGYGGTVKLRNMRYKPNGTHYQTKYVSKPNVFICGEQAPQYNADGTAIINGSVIEGRFNVWAHGFRHENVGYDLGKAVCDAYYPGMDTHAANHPDGATWDAFAFGNPNQVGPFVGEYAPRTGYYARNVLGLLRDNLSVGHAILQEGFVGGYIENVAGLGGVHAHVIKAKGVRGGAVQGYGASVNDVIFKSDTYAIGGDIILSSVVTGVAPPGVIPWWGLLKAENSLNLNAALADMAIVQITSAALYGSTVPLAFTGIPGSPKTISDVQIGLLLVDGIGVAMDTPIRKTDVHAVRVQITTALVNNCGAGPIWSQDFDHKDQALEIGTLRCTNVPGSGIVAQSFGVVRVGTYTTDNVGAAYQHDGGDSRILIDKGPTTGFGVMYANNPWQFSPGWSSYGGGNEPAAIVLEDYGVRAKGLWKNDGAPSGEMAVLPAFLRSRFDQRKNGPGNSNPAVPINVTSTGFLGINGLASFTDGGTGGATAFMSMDNNVYWSL